MLALSKGYEVIRIVSWNIAKRHQPWRELLRMDADVALLQESGDPPSDVKNSVQEGPWENYDSHVIYSSSHRRHWPNLYDRWCRVVKLSDRVDIEWLTQIPPVAEAPEGTIPVSGIGTIGAAIVTPRYEEIEPFTVVSMYGRWMGSRAPKGKMRSISMPDTAIHRIISDISWFVGDEDPSTHRVLAAGDLNLDYGWLDEGVSWYGKRAQVVWDRFGVLGFEYLGPQSPNGRMAVPTPAHLPHDTKNVPTFRSNFMSPMTAQLQLDHVFASRGFHESIQTRALNCVCQWGSSDHCRIVIDVKE